MLDYSLESHLYFWCKMQFTSYPFDKHVSSAICKGRIFEVCHFSLYLQTCKFRFGSYGYNDSYIQFYTRDIVYKQDSEEQATGLQYKVVSVSPLKNPVYKTIKIGTCLQKGPTTHHTHTATNNIYSCIRQLM